MLTTGAARHAARYADDAAPGVAASSPDDAAPGVAARSLGEAAVAAAGSACPLAPWSSVAALHVAFAAGLAPLWRATSGG